MNESTPQSPRTIPHRGRRLGLTKSTVRNVLEVTQPAMCWKSCLPLLWNPLPLLLILLKHWRKQ